MIARVVPIDRPTERWPVAAETGLTLLEMLIVLAVIAIATGATLLSIGPRRGDATEVEARRLAAMIQTATDRSIATGGAAELVVDAHGYTVAGGTRQVLPDDVELRSPAPVLPLTLDASRPFDLTVVRNGVAWRVGFDGVRAVAAATKVAA